MYKTLLRISPDAICLFDGDGEIIMSNDKAAELLKCSRVDLIGRSVYSLVGPEDHDRVAESGTIIDRDGVLLNRRFLLILDDKSSIPVEVSYSSVPAENGLIKGYLAIFRDITEKIRAEEENARLQSQLLSIIIKRLSVREVELLRHIYDGLSWPDKKAAIAETMRVVPGTLDKFMSRIRTKLETDDIAMILQIAEKGLGWKRG